MKIKKSDTVLIISGKDRGRKGKVLEVFPKEGKILVEGANLMRKHQKPRKAGEKGQIIQLPKPIAISNVKLICPKCGKPTKVGHKVVNKNKARICKKCESEI